VKDCLILTKGEKINLILKNVEPPHLELDREILVPVLLSIFVNPFGGTMRKDQTARQDTVKTTKRSNNEGARRKAKHMENDQNVFQLAKTKRSRGGNEARGNSTKRRKKAA
jgi:hypothetical protein